MWTFLKLNTVTGQIWQVQYSVEGPDYRFESILDVTPRISEYFDDPICGRFTLYPTKNTYNFILLDQIDGRCWQVQWNIEPSNRAVIRIYWAYKQHCFIIIMQQTWTSSALKPNGYTTIMKRTNASIWIAVLFCSALRTSTAAILSIVISWQKIIWNSTWSTLIRHLSKRNTRLFIFQLMAGTAQFTLKV